MPPCIGLLVGHERAFPEAFMARCARAADVRCELARIGVTGERHISRYDVLIDRLGAALPLYRSYLRASLLAGTTVINDPSGGLEDDAFASLALAARLGLAVPRTVLLPQHSFRPPIIPERSLRNLEFPFNWHAMADYVRYPCVLRAAVRPELVKPTVVHGEEELLRAFDRTGSDVVVAQQLFDRAGYVRALCVGREHVALVPGLGAPSGIEPSPMPPRNAEPRAALGAELSERIRQDTLTLARAVGCELCSVDYALHEEVPYVVSPPEPVPELDPALLGEPAFARVVGWLGALAIRRARAERRLPGGYAGRTAKPPEDRSSSLSFGHGSVNNPRERRLPG